MSSSTMMTRRYYFSCTTTVITSRFVIISGRIGFMLRVRQSLVTKKNAHTFVTIHRVKFNDLVFFAFAQGTNDSVAALRLRSGFKRGRSHNIKIDLLRKNTCWSAR